MTENEAIEKLRAYHKCQRLQVKGIYEDCNEKLCDNCDLCYAQGNTGEHIKSIEIAIQALEKQVPKKMIKTPHAHIDLILMYRCPSCDTEYNRFYENKKYCMECGQKLDWSEEE